jgi:hypothetical protein
MSRRALAAFAIASISLAGCSSDERRSLASMPVTTPVASTTSSSTTTSTSSTTSTTAAPTTTRPSGLYEPVPGPSLTGERTDEFAGDGPLGNGQYWVTYNGTTTPDAPFVSLFIAYFGEACVEAAAAFNDECFGDLFVTPTPTRDIDDVPVSDDALITVADARSSSNYRITFDELSVASTGLPSPEAPDGYTYYPFAFLMTVIDGEIVAFEQFRTS